MGQTFPLSREVHPRAAKNKPESENIELWTRPTPAHKRYINLTDVALNPAPAPTAPAEISVTPPAKDKDTALKNPAVEAEKEYEFVTLPHSKRTPQDIAAPREAYPQIKRSNIGRISSRVLKRTLQEDNSLIPRMPS